MSNILLGIIALAVLVMAVLQVAVLALLALRVVNQLARVVDVYARRLQTQETMTAQITEAIDTALKPRGIAVGVLPVQAEILAVDPAERGELCAQLGLEPGPLGHAYLVPFGGECTNGFGLVRSVVEVLEFTREPPFGIDAGSSGMTRSSWPAQITMPPEC